MARDNSVVELLRTWDSIVGDRLLGEEGVATVDGYWVPLAILTLRAALSDRCVDADPDVVAQGIVTSLAPLDLLSIDVLSGLDPDAPTEDFELLQRVMRHHGLSAETAALACASLALLAARWKHGVGDVRPVVRAELTRLAEDLGRLVPVTELGEVGVEAHDVARTWASIVLGVPPPWSDAAGEFMAKFGLQPDELAAAADRLDRTTTRVDILVSTFMDAYCRGCDPRQRASCVEDAAKAGVAMACPLLAG